MERIRIYFQGQGKGEEQTGEQGNLQLPDPPCGFGGVYDENGEEEGAKETGMRLYE